MNDKESEWHSSVAEKRTKVIKVQGAYCGRFGVRQVEGIEEAKRAGDAIESLGICT